jgi:predicted phage terminase large subunit-like protein
MDLEDLSMPLYVLLYGFPQILFPIALLAILIVTLFSSWTFLFALIFLLPLPAYGRYIFELRAYRTRQLLERNFGSAAGVKQAENDLTGYLLKETPELYRHICLPATASNLISPTSLEKNYVDGLFDPVRLPRVELSSLKKTLGSRGYAGQYDQNPSPEEGGIFKVNWFQIVRPETLQRDLENEPVHFFIDSAYTAKTENDPTSILTGFRQGNFFYILDVQEVWLAFPELIKYIQEHVKKFQLSSSSKIFIEPKASGLDIVHQLRAITMLNVIEHTSPTADKIVRANAISPTCESMRVRLVEGRYIDKFLEQIRLFPNVEHDDMVDTLVMGTDQLLLKDTLDFAMI